MHYGLRIMNYFVPLNYVLRYFRSKIFKYIWYFVRLFVPLQSVIGIYRLPYKNSEPMSGCVTNSVLTLN